MKLAIIGRGTVGAVTAAHFATWAKNTTIDWYYDENIKTQAVGEGTTLILPYILKNYFNLNYNDMKNLNGNYKYGIRKQNWGKDNHDFFHHFYPPDIAMHIDSYKLQDFIFNKLLKYKHVNVISKNITSHDEVDADYIIDCSGKPRNFDDFYLAEHIPVNSVYVTQCHWDKPDFDYTAAIARKHGWVFCIPLQNRCSVGYMYNNTINKLSDIKKDVQAVFSEYNLTPSEHTNAFSFRNYVRKVNFTERVSYNGNSSFFLEPMEATSFVCADVVNRLVYDHLFHGIDLPIIHKHFNNLLMEIELMIAFHYTKKSKFNTKFWDFAYEKTKDIMPKLYSNDKFLKCLNSITSHYIFPDINSFGSWNERSWYENLIGLGYKIQGLPDE